jgi:cytochrome b561
MKTILVSRYHPLLVTLHWLLAVLIVAMLCVGFFLLAPMPNMNPQKIGILLIHMSVGMLILALMAVRFIVRMRTSGPADATIGSLLLDRLAPLAHYGFYILALLMVGTGFATAILAGLNRSVFQGSGDPLPPSLLSCPASCRFHHSARARRALSPIRCKRPTVRADVVRATCFRCPGAGEIIQPIQPIASR